LTRRAVIRACLGLVAGLGTGLFGLPFPRGGLAALLLVALPPLAPGAFAAAGWWVAWSTRAVPGPAPCGPVVLEGRVVTVPDRFADRLRLRLRTADTGLLVELTARPTEWPISAGDRIRVAATLRPPAPARNPGGRDQALRLAASGVAFQAAAVGPIVRTAPPSPAAWLERARERLAEAAARHLPAREAALVRAIGTGDRAALDPATVRSFARSGLAHVLAVSGLHLVVVALGLERLLRALLLRSDTFAARHDPRRASAALALPVTALYALATGAGVPVLRAALAAAVALAGALLSREPHAPTSLALCALALLAADPGAALDPSLQLSFAAVGGLALWAGPLRRALPLPRAPAGTWRARLAEPLAAGACASLAASIATAPVLAQHFRQLPLLGLLANVLGVPIGSALTVLATIAALLAAASPALAAPALLACRPLAAALLGLSDLAAAPTWSVLGVGAPGLAGALAFYALAFAGTRRRGAARALLWAGAALALLLPGPLRAAAARARGGLEVTFLYVGHGDSALLRLPDGSAVLVDAGGSPGGGPDPGARDVVPLLRDLGVRRVALAFASHPHPDHVLGLAAVADAMPIARLLSNGELGEGEARAVLTALAPEDFPPGASLERAGVRFEALGGERAGLLPNDASLVLRVTYGETSFLFPGDVEPAGEAAAVARGGLASDVVKIPHHGSRRSSTRPFVAAVRPRHAVVSNSAEGRYGFPHAEALARWRQAGAEVQRADAGAVRFLSDGRSVRRLPAADVLDPLAVLREGEGPGNGRRRAGGPRRGRPPLRRARGDAGFRWHGLWNHAGHAAPPRRRRPGHADRFSGGPACHGGWLAGRRGPTARRGARRAAARAVPGRSGGDTHSARPAGGPAPRASRRAQAAPPRRARRGGRGGAEPAVAGAGGHAGGGRSAPHRRGAGRALAGGALRAGRRRARPAARGGGAGPRARGGAPPARRTGLAAARPGAEAGRPGAGGGPRLEERAPGERRARRAAAGDAGPRRRAGAGRDRRRPGGPGPCAGGAAAGNPPSPPGLAAPAPRRGGPPPRALRDRPAARGGLSFTGGSAPPAPTGEAGSGPHPGSRESAPTALSAPAPPARAGARKAPGGARRGW